MAGVGGRKAATTLIPTATGTDQRRTTFQASTISTTQVPISQKYVALADGAFITTTRRFHRGGLGTGPGIPSFGRERALWLSRQPEGSARCELRPGPARPRSVGRSAGEEVDQGGVEGGQ